MTFKIGDVVRLKTGGEAMTVEGLSDFGLKCVWFVLTEKSGYSGPHRSTFREETLEACDRDAVPTPDGEQLH